MGISQDLYKKAKTLIPGGTQLLSKRPEMFLPDQWPAYYEKSKGCEVWDLDNKHYYDFSEMGIGACVLGYADEDVNRAVVDVIKKGTMTTLNAPEEVKLAELLLGLHPWASMVRYARSGGEAMSVAVRIARAYSKKDIIMFCGYHGWHDWYLASNLADDRALDGHLLPGLQPAGVPRSLIGVAVPFSYNNSAEFLEKLHTRKDMVGAVVLEAVRNDEPEKEFLEVLKRETVKNGIPLIVDEITSGWRLNLGGAHLLYNYEPDIAVFAKAMSNGYPMAAIVGKKNVMEAAQGSFISSTYWTERIGPVAAIATIEKMKSQNVQQHLKNAGKQVKTIWREAAAANGLKIHISGIDPLGHFEFTEGDHLTLKTLLTQEMLREGFLASTSYYASFAHQPEEIDRFKRSVNKVFRLLSGALKEGTAAKLLNGPVCHSGFKRLI
ncbi:MAG: aminotransferase class III-fold pyridoxal phosphate-dependent enzyme [Bacteroidota bacterium]